MKTKFPQQEEECKSDPPVELMQKMAELEMLLKSETMRADHLNKQLGSLKAWLGQANSLLRAEAVHLMAIKEHLDDFEARKE